MRFLSIQSSVAYGHVGNSRGDLPAAAARPRGLAGAHGALLQPHRVRRVARAAARPRRRARGDRRASPSAACSATCDAVLSGYQGGRAVGEVVLDAVALVKAANPAAVYCCDPVMGDVGRGCSSTRRSRRVHARAASCRRPTSITPNQFELDFLTGTSTRTRSPSTLDVGRRRPRPRPVDRAGHRRSCDRDGPEDTIDMVAVTDDGAWTVRTPLLPIKANGSGDLTAALFIAHLAETGSRRRGAGAYDLVGVRRARGDAGVRRARAADRRRPGRDRPPGAASSRSSRSAEPPRLARPASGGAHSDRRSVDARTRTVRGSSQPAPRWRPGHARSPRRRTTPTFRTRGADAARRRRLLAAAVTVRGARRPWPADRRSARSPAPTRTGPTLMSRPVVPTEPKPTTCPSKPGTPRFRALQRPWRRIGSTGDPSIAEPRDRNRTRDISLYKSKRSTV